MENNSQKNFEENRISISNKQESNIKKYDSFYGSYDFKDNNDNNNFFDYDETMVYDISFLSIENNPMENKKNKKNKKLNLNDIDKLYSFSYSFEKQEMRNKDLSFSIDNLQFSLINNKDNSKNNFSNLEKMFYENNNEFFSKLDYLFQKLNGIIHKKTFLNSYFRFTEVLEKNKLEDKYYIPLVKCGWCINFLYENKNIELDLDTLFNYINNQNIFFKNELKNRNKLEQAYVCQIHKKKFITYCFCKKNVCEDCLKNEHICHKEYLLKQEMNDYDIYSTKKRVINAKIKTWEQISFLKKKMKFEIKELNNDKYTNEFKNEIILRIKNMYGRLKKLINFYFYFSFIKALIYEKIKLSKEKYNYYLIKNLILFNNYFVNEKKRLINKKNKIIKRQKIICKINFIIPFYSNNNINKNIYIGIDSNGFIVIFDFNFNKINDNINDLNNININNNIINNNYNKNNNIINNELDFDSDNNNRLINDLGENIEYYKIISFKDLGQVSPQKIMRLQKYCHYKNESKNIFLVSFPSAKSSYEIIGEAKIIEISNNYKEFTILHNIKYYCGLINTIEIHFNDSYYYLNCTKGLILWDYDYDNNKFEYKEIVPKLINNDIKINNDYKNYKNYKEIIYSEKRKLIIIQCYYPKQYIYFFTINDNNKNLNITFIKLITIEKDEIYFSSEPWNSCLINDKYLLIGTKISKLVFNNANNKNNKINKNNKNKKNNKNIMLFKKRNKNKKITSGFYIIDLDDYENIKIEYINNSRNISCITKVRENIFICNVDFTFKNDYTHKNYGLMSFEILEKNGKIIINKKAIKNGDHKMINNRDMINDCFILCSLNKNNQMLKIDEEGNIIFFFDLIIEDKIN